MLILSEERKERKQLIEQEQNGGYSSQRPYRGAHLSVEWQGGQCDRCAAEGKESSQPFTQFSALPRTRVPNTAVNSHCRGLNRHESQYDSFCSAMCSTIGKVRDKKRNRKTSSETMAVT